jgi:aldehyde:ferredoxin oxidoreductase
MQILRINLTDRTSSVEELPENYRLLGGRALTARFIADEVPPRCDALGSENKLVFAAGICAGTSVANSGRLSIGAKSPLTGTIKESNSGGSAAQKMARLGYRAVIMEGAASEFVTVEIDRSGVRFKPAAEVEGFGNYRLIDTYRADYGESICILSIGQAGEKALKASAISVTTPDFHIRVAARGGLGSVMGSKKLKALILNDQGCSPVAVADREALTAAAQAFSKGVLGHPLIGALRTFGTPVLVNMMNEMGTIVTKNFSRGKFEGAEKISGERIADLIEKRPNGVAAHGCMRGCIIQCSNVFTNEAGEFVTASIEYETLALMGSNCMIDDIDAIARMNRACNDFGVDTMDVGGAIAVAMEAGLLPWGDAAEAQKIVEEIGSGGDRGLMVGNGVKYTGETLGVQRIPHVKGQCLAGYDPRGLKGTGVTYATSPMGADHTAGNALPSHANPAYNPASATGQGQVSQFLQRYFAAVDSLGLCLFATLPALDIPELQKHLTDCVSAILNEPLGDDYLLQMGGAVLKVEKEYNDKAGFTMQDDRLPEFFTKEALPETGLLFDVPMEELDSVHGN